MNQKMNVYVITCIYLFIYPHISHGLESQLPTSKFTRISQEKIDRKTNDKHVEDPESQTLQLLQQKSSLFKLNRAKRQSPSDCEWILEEGAHHRKRDTKCCKPLWYKYCQDDNVCCSKNCYREAHWKYGVCKPNPGSSQSCKPLWDNHCQEDNDCCSKNCYKESHWKYGVCKP